MPTWEEILTTILTLEPQIAAFIQAIVAAFGGNTPTPAQIEALTQHLHARISDSLTQKIGAKPKP